MENAGRNAHAAMLEKALTEVKAKADEAEGPVTWVQLTLPTPSEATYRILVQGQEDYVGGYITD